jgi:TetR/AcrR family transcriptional regulator, tetracycline repressor protein
MGRPLEPLIYRDEVIAAALSIIDERGLERLSMRSLATAINVAPASLYHHFLNREEILDEVSKLILSEVQVSQDPERPWRENVIAQVLSTLRVLVGHPNALPMLSRMPHRRFGLGTAEYLAESFRSEGVPVEYVLPAMESIFALTLGIAMSAVNADRVAQWGDTEKYPTLGKVVKASRMGSEQQLKTAVGAFIDGWIARYGRRNKIR